MKQYIWLLFPLLALGALSTLGGCCSRTVPSELSHCDRELSTRVVSVRIVPGAILPLPTGDVEYSQGGAYALNERELILTQHQLTLPDGTVPQQGVIKVNDEMVTSYTVRSVSAERDRAVVELDSPHALDTHPLAIPTASCSCGCMMIEDGSLAWLVTPTRFFCGRVYLVQLPSGSNTVFFAPESHAALDRPGLSGYPVFARGADRRVKFLGINVGTADVTIEASRQAHIERMKLLGW